MSVAPPGPPDRERRGTDPPTGPVLSLVNRTARGTRTSDRVFEQLLGAIHRLRLVPGQSLFETELSRDMGVSRTPIREAIARLSDAGLVDVVPQVGTHVSLIKLADVEEAQFVRESLELSAFAVACARPTRDVSALRSLLTEQERAHAEQDLDAFFAADEALHEQIFALSGHSGAWAAMQPMKSQLDRLRRLSLPEPTTVRQLIDEHTAIVDALEAGDCRQGRSLLGRHVSRVRQYGPTLQVKYPDYFTE